VLPHAHFPAIAPWQRSFGWGPSDRVAETVKNTAKREALLRKVVWCVLFARPHNTYPQVQIYKRVNDLPKNSPEWRAMAQSGKEWEGYYEPFSYLHAQGQPKRVFSAWLT